MIAEAKDFSFHRRQRSVNYHAKLSWPDNCPEAVKQIVWEAMSLDLINNIARVEKIITDTEHRKMSVLIHSQMRQRLHEAIQHKMKSNHVESELYEYASYAHAEAALLRSAGGYVNTASTNNQKGDGIDSLCP